MSELAVEEVIIHHAVVDFMLISSLRRKVPLLQSLQPLDTIQAEQLALTLSEHLTNLLQHNVKPCYVSIALLKDPKSILIRDNGRDIAELLHEVDRQSTPDPMQESGRGLWLLKRSFPKLTYSSDATGNLLCLPFEESQPRLVVIDDDPIQVALLEVWLGNDYQLEGFCDPQAALQYLTLHPVDLIICDICMPEMDGLTLRKHLLETTQAESVPFLFLSALDDEALKNRAVDLLIDDFITKPIRESVLKQTVRRILKRNLQVRHNADLKLEQAVTQSLWSDLTPEWQGWQLDLAYLVATKGGGDFVFQQQRPQSMLLVLGDVMGHGLQAKFFAFAMCGYLQGMCYAVAGNQSPGQLLSTLSEAVRLNSVLQKTLVTLLVIELFADGRVLLACGGHPAPYLFRPEHDSTFLNLSGVLPGLQPQASYDELSLNLSSDEVLFVFSDGLTEQFPSSHCLSENDLPNVFSMLCSKSNSVNLNAFLQLNYPQPQPDDLTLMSIRRL